MKSEFAYPLNCHARDTTTGFEGVITARIEYSHGPDRYCLENATAEKWIDEERVDPVDLEATTQE